MNRKRERESSPKGNRKKKKRDESAVEQEVVQPKEMKEQVICNQAEEEQTEREPLPAVPAEMEMEQEQVDKQRQTELETDKEVESGTSEEETNDIEDIDIPRWMKGLRYDEVRSEEKYPLEYTVKFCKDSRVEKYVINCTKTYRQMATRSPIVVLNIQ